MELDELLKHLQHPLDADFLLRKQKGMRRKHRAAAKGKQIRIAILGGSTTDEVANLIELFLLKEGFQPTIYQSQYNRYYEEAIFGSSELDEFDPQYVYIHTTSLNINSFPAPCDSEKEVDVECF